MIHVWKSLSEYLSKGAYIVNFVDEKKVCEDIILIVAIDEKKRLVTIRYKKLTGDIVEQTLLFEEYADDFLSESIQKHLVRFDIFDIVKQTGQVDRKEIREHWENAKLSFLGAEEMHEESDEYGKSSGRMVCCFSERGFIFGRKGRYESVTPLCSLIMNCFLVRVKILGRS